MRRYHVLEMALWNELYGADGVCIDQDNGEERGHQVQLIAKIYGKANRVIVWLGEMADER
jgi:hypothetical protein